MSSGYSFNVKFISRGQGQSVVAKGAYHARAEFREERTGEKKDYTYKADRPAWSGVFVEKGAPESFKENESLLNEMDRAEKRSDAQTALNFMGALPSQLTDQQRQYLVTDFCREEFVRKHLAAVAHIHRPSQHGDQRNDHVHILVGTRTVNSEGFGEKFLTWDSYAEHQNRWREKWASLGARYLEKAGFKEEADQWREGHKTLEQKRQAALERGDLAFAETLKDKQATKHRGVKADAIERKGEQTERGNIYRDTVENNRTRGDFRALKTELEMVQVAIAKYESEWTDRLAAAAIEKEKQTAQEQQQKGQQEKDQPKPDGLRGAALHIWTASQNNDNAHDFAAALDRNGIALAVVTPDEAQRSHMNASFAKEVGGYSPNYRAGAIVAVTMQGQVHALTPRNTGRDWKEIEEFFAPLDASQLPSVETTQAAQRDMRPQDAPEHLKGTAAHIWLANRRSDDPRSFAAALGEKGITLARTTKEEAEQSNSEAEAARLEGRYPKATGYRQGEIVAVNRWGKVYRLNEQTTGSDFMGMQRYLQKSDAPNMQSISETQREKQYRQDDENKQKQRGKTLLNAHFRFDEGGSPANDPDVKSLVLDHTERRTRANEKAQSTARNTRDS